MKSAGKYGYIAKTGAEKIPFRYDEAHEFSDSIARIYAADPRVKKWGFIDKTGRWVIPPTFDQVNNFSNGCARVRSVEGKYGYVDKAGKYKIELKYQHASDFSEQLAPVAMSDYSKWSFIDTTGKEVVALSMDGRDGDVRAIADGMAMLVLYSGWKYGFVDKAGKEVIPPAYEDAFDFSEGFAAVKLNGKWGFIDKTGKEIGQH